MTSHSGNYMLSVMEGRGGRQTQLELYFLSCASGSCNWIQFRDRKDTPSFRAFNMEAFFTGFIISLQNETGWIEMS